MSLAAGDAAQAPFAASSIKSMENGYQMGIKAAARPRRKKWPGDAFMAVELMVSWGAAIQGAAKRQYQ